MSEQPTTTTHSALMERRRALYAQLSGVEQQRQGVLMEIAAIDREIRRATGKEISDAKSDAGTGPHPKRRG